jgi:ketosteroid isomerase-like protein
VGDELAIRNRLVAFAQASDFGELSEVMAFFTEDARLVVGDQPPIEGLPAVTEQFRRMRDAGLTGPRNDCLDVVGPPVVSLAGDNARTRSYFELLVDTRSEPRIRSAGIFEDHWRRTPVGWCVEARVVILKDAAA